MRHLTALVAFLFLAPSLLAEIRVEENIVYSRPGGTELALDLALPEGDGPHPVVLCIHGGAWRAGNRKGYGKLIRNLATEGFAAATMSYRFAPDHVWPAQLEDCRAALGWIHENSKKYGLDPERIGATGHSAGGHLSLMLGTIADGPEGEKPLVRAVVNFFGPTDLTRKNVYPEWAERVIADLGGGERDEKPAQFSRMSPITHLAAGDAPVLTFHGDQDKTVPVSQARELHAASQARGHVHRLEVLEGAGHGWGGERAERTTKEALAFFKLYLVPSELPLVMREDFENGVERWQPTDANAWKEKTHEGDGFFSLIKKKSDYRPKVRSPFNIALLKEVEVGDFVLDLRFRSTIPDYGHRSLCLFFGHQDPSNFYYVHFGKKADAHANSVFLVNDEPRVSIVPDGQRTEGTPWDDAWHHARIRRSLETGKIEVYFDDMTKPIMVTTDRTFGKGRIGIGSFDDTGDFDSVRLYGR